LKPGDAAQRVADDHEFLLAAIAHLTQHSQFVGDHFEPGFELRFVGVWQLRI
jgi:hypothetical protein